MTHFEKTKFKSFYQVVVNGKFESHTAIITKDFDESVWWVSRNRDGEVFKSAAFTGPIKTLSDAKEISASWVSEGR